MPSFRIISFPFFLATGLFLILGFGCFFSALCAKYRDIKFAVPFLLQIWFWLTPVAYGMENIPNTLKTFFYLNPMTWIIQGFRWSLLNSGEMDWIRFFITFLFSLLILLTGIIYFGKKEREFADII